MEDGPFGVLYLALSPDAQLVCLQTWRDLRIQTVGQPAERRLLLPGPGATKRWIVDNFAIRLFSPNSQLFAYGSNTLDLSIYSCTTGQPLITLPGTVDAFYENAVCFSANSQYFFTGAEDGTVVRYSSCTVQAESLKFGQPALASQHRRIAALQYNQAKGIIVGLDLSPSIYIWEASTGRLMQSGHCLWWPRADFHLSRSGEILALVEADPSFSWCNYSVGLLFPPASSPPQLQRKTTTIRQTTLSPSGRWFIIIEERLVVSLSNTSTGCIQWSKFDIFCNTFAAAPVFSPNEKILVISNTLGALIGLCTGTGDILYKITLYSHPVGKRYIPGSICHRYTERGLQTVFAHNTLPELLVVPDPMLSTLLIAVLCDRRCHRSRLPTEIWQLIWMEFIL